MIFDLVEGIESLLFVPGVVYGCSDVGPDETGGFILYMEWGITSEQFTSRGATRALHESRADKAFVVVVLWCGEIHHITMYATRLKIPRGRIV
jgi:hypothetical protein